MGTISTVGGGIGYTLPDPPREYDQQYVAALVHALELALTQLRNPGIPQYAALLLTGEKLPENLESPLNVKNLPTSSVGLNVGDVWNDGGTLKIVT